MPHILFHRACQSGHRYTFATQPEGSHHEWACGNEWYMWTLMTNQCCLLGKFTTVHKLFLTEDLYGCIFHYFKGKQCDSLYHTFSPLPPQINNVF